MECARGYEKYEVCLHRAVLCGNRAALDYRQYVTLHAFAGYVCTAGIAAGDFQGITVAEFGVDTFAQDSEVRVAEQGAIWLTAGGAVNAGDQIMCTTAGVYKTWVASTASNFKLDGYAETSASSGAVFKFLLRSTNAVAA